MIFHKNTSVTNKMTNSLCSIHALCDVIIYFFYSQALVRWLLILAAYLLNTIATSTAWEAEKETRRRGGGTIGMKVRREEEEERRRKEGE